jgi:pimeloyl-ACP methyl ester carboxylesterase
MPAKLGAHELVLLHGQPGSAADWLQVAGRLPAQLHAVAADRPGYGSSQLRAGGFAANAQAVLDDLDSRGIKRAVLVGTPTAAGWHCPRRAWLRTGWRRWSCSPASAPDA